MDHDLDGQLLAAVGLSHDDDSREALAQIGSTPVPAELFHRLLSRLDYLLPNTPDPAFVLRALQRFIAASRSPTALLALFERDERSLPTLLKVLGAGQRLAGWLVADPESFDLVRAIEGAEVSKATLVDEIVVELEALAQDDEDQLIARRVLHSVYRRERLRIAYADVVEQVTPQRVAAQLSVLADAIIESAVQHVRGRLAQRYGQPRTPNGQPGRFAVIGLAALGGRELSYDSPLDLVFLRDLCGPTDGQLNLPADEFFDRLAAGVLTLLGEQNVVPEESFPGIYDVASSHRPRTDAGSLALTLTEAYRHYQLTGRTWERLLYVKSRCVAGDESLGNEFLDLMEAWVYRRYLEPADVEGLHTLVRKFSRRVIDSEPLVAPTNAPLPLDVATCPGGLHDVDAVIGLLQLINGVELTELRSQSTLDAIDGLCRSDLLSVQEATLLTDHTVLLRRYLHMCQAEADGEDVVLVDQNAKARRDQRIAWHLGFRNAKSQGAPERLSEAIATAIGLNRTTIARLLRDTAFESQSMPVESELLLDPDPDQAVIRTTMQQHGMADPLAAMADLQRLASEPVPFLSSRRCRHVLAAIAPQLLAEIARTPSPDETLSTLVEVSDSLGGKAVLWELFGATPPTMHLMVRLCACSPYLSRILIRNPGMIDDLMDSLLLDRLPTARWLENASTELCRGYADVDPIIASFKNGAHLQIGVRDVLGKESLEATHAALANTAECALRRIAESSTKRLADRFGDPFTEDGQEIELVMLGLGKLGAREPNYLSDLDVLFLYTSDGHTKRRIGGHRSTTSATQFFHDVTTDIRHRVCQVRDGAQLYELGSNLSIARGTATPPAAISMDALRHYFLRGEATLLQRLALCKARAVSGSVGARARADQLVRELLCATEWYPFMAAQIRDARVAMEVSAANDNLKRAAGGTVDVEWITQTLQLRHAAAHPELLVPGTTDALQKLSDAGLIDPLTATSLITNYRLLREVESKLCLLGTPKHHEIPDDPQLLSLLAFLMDEPRGDQILVRCRECRAANRRLFNQIFEELVTSTR